MVWYKSPAKRNTLQNRFVQPPTDPSRTEPTEDSPTSQYLCSFRLTTISHFVAVMMTAQQARRACTAVSAGHGGSHVNSPRCLVSRTSGGTPPAATTQGSRCYYAPMPAAFFVGRKEGKPERYPSHGSCYVLNEIARKSGLEVPYEVPHLYATRNAVSNVAVISNIDQVSYHHANTKTAAWIFPISVLDLWSKYTMPYPGFTGDCQDLRYTLRN